MEWSRKVGGHLLRSFDELKAKMVNPDHTLHIQILKDKVFVSARRVEGLGGLPVSSSGHMLCLLSGGFDSPVASTMMFPRGVEQSFAYLVCTTIVTC